MSPLPTDHPVEWVTAAPLWSSFDSDPVRMRKPALLCFETDEFIEELTSLLATDPRQLPTRIALPRSYGGSGFGNRSDPTVLAQGSMLKLFQPVHGSFTLIAASLVCRSTGLPDRTIHTTRRERVGFVLRRLDEQGAEMAWITEPPTCRGWRGLSLAQESTVVTGEEILPLFPVNYRDDDHPRKLLAGLVPTSSREAYIAADRLAPLDAEGDPRIAELKIRVIEPLAALRAPPPVLEGADTLERSKIAASNTQREIEASRFLLLDLAELLFNESRDVWDSLVADVWSAPRGQSPRLFDLLKNRASPAFTWRDALVAAWNEKSVITGPNPETSTLNFSLRDAVMDARHLEEAVSSSLVPFVPPADQSKILPPVPQLDPLTDTRYVLRCVYQRPECGALHDDVVSVPTEQFTLAPFFDSDAPSRPLRITLPADTSIAGLRKFSRNVGFVFSKTFRDQMQTVSDAKQALKGNLGAAGSFDLGEICSFSIPIITICAVLVLMIFIVLLNIVFWWLPFVRICFPLPKPKGA
jgi:hypothetical protein